MRKLFEINSRAFGTGIAGIMGKTRRIRIVKIHGFDVDGDPQIEVQVKRWFGWQKVYQGYNRKTGLAMAVANKPEGKRETIEELEVPV